MDCLKGYIGISPDIGTVESDLYLIELQGVTRDNLLKIASKPDQQDVQEVFNDCEKRAILSLKAAFKARLNECYRIANTDIIECLICENIEELAVALWYLIGAEVMSERQHSDRLNRFTTIDRKKAGELQTLFEERYAGELHNAVMGINPNDSDCVAQRVEHNGIVRKVLPIL